MARFRNGVVHLSYLICYIFDCKQDNLHDDVTSSLSLEVSGTRSRDRPKKKWRDNIQGDMKKYQLTEDTAQDQKYWMTQIMAGPAQGDGKER